MASMYCWLSVSVKHGANLVIAKGIFTLCCKITWRMKLFTFI